MLLRKEEKPPDYLMNKGYQHLLEIASSAGQKPMNRLSVFAHMDWKVITQQHAS